MAQIAAVERNSRSESRSATESSEFRGLSKCVFGREEDVAVLFAFAYFPRQEAYPNIRPDQPIGSNALVQDVEAVHQKENTPTVPLRIER